MNSIILSVSKIKPEWEELAHFKCKAIKKTYSHPTAGEVTMRDVASTKIIRSDGLWPPTPTTIEKHLYEGLLKRKADKNLPNDTIAGSELYGQGGSRTIFSTRATEGIFGDDRGRSRK